MNRKVIKYSVVSFSLVLLLGIYFILNTNVENKYEGEYTVPILKEESLPTSTVKTIIRPYTNNSVVPIINYYDENDLKKEGEVYNKGGDGTVPNWSSLLVGLKWIYDKKTNPSSSFVAVYTIF